MHATLLLFAGALAACTPHAAPRNITLAVATDLAPWARTHQRDLARALGGPVSIVAGPSGQLATQLLAGAPFDLLLAADRATLDRLVTDPRCVAGSLRSFATGHLGIALAGHLGGEPSPATLASPAVSTIAIASPEHAPYGRLARTYLASLPEGPELLSKLVIAASAADAAAWVDRGAADAAVTAWSLLRTQTASRHAEVNAAATILPASGIVCGPDAPSLSPRWQALTSAPWFRESLAAAGFGPPP